MPNPKHEVRVLYTHSRQNENSPRTHNSKGIQNHEGTQSSKGSSINAALKLYYPYLLHNAAASRIRSSHISLIKWTDEKGKVQRFYLMDKISHKWRDIGELLDIPYSELESIFMKCHGNPKDCCRDILGQWLENPPPEYSATWQGLIDLLEDSRLGQVASELRIALENVHL